MCGRKLSGFSFGKRLCQWCLRHEAAQRGELPEDAPLPVMPVPWQGTDIGSMNFAHALVGINVVIFIAMAISGVSVTDPSGQALVRWGANYGPLTVSGEWWRLISYNFLHGGIIHLAFNMWCLWDLGALCESLYGTWTFGALYMISGVAGGLASIGFNPGRLSVGASGAIFGLAGALIAGYYLGEFSVPRPLIQARLRSIALFVIYNIVFGAVSGGTDNMCHLGGLVAGLICGALIARLAPRAEDVFGRAAIILVMGAILAGITLRLEHQRSYLIHAQRGSMFLAQGKYDEAIGELQSTLRERPSYSDARLALVHAYYDKGQYDHALSEVKQVLAVDPQNSDGLYYLGFLYIKERLPEQAQTTFSKLLQQDSTQSGAHYGLGLALAELGNDKAAIEEYKKTISMSPEFEGVYYNLGLSQSKLKLYDDAIAAFRKEQQIADDYETELALADACEAKGLRADAAAARQKAEQLKGK